MNIVEAAQNTIFRPCTSLTCNQKGEIVLEACYDTERKIAKNQIHKLGTHLGYMYFLCN